LSYIGWSILAIGGTAVSGYIFNMPYLYHDIEGWSNPMACHTSVLFVLIGVSLIFLKLKH
jgi:hypothetical protein